MTVVQSRISPLLGPNAQKGATDREPEILDTLRATNSSPTSRSSDGRTPARTTPTLQQARSVSFSDVGSWGFPRPLKARETPPQQQGNGHLRMERDVGLAGRGSPRTSDTLHAVDSASREPVATPAWGFPRAHG